MSEHARCPICHELLYEDEPHHTLKGCLENALDRLSHLRAALVEHDRAMTFVLQGGGLIASSLRRSAGSRT